MGKEAYNFTHKCELGHSQMDDNIVNQYVDAGICITVRRFVRRCTMVHTMHPWTKFYVRSIPAKRKEETYHLLNHYYMIHPLSKFVLYRRFLMFFILTGIYCIIPFMVLFLKSKKNYIFVGLSTLQLFFMAEMIMTFFTGYFGTTRIVLSPKQVAIKYLKTYLIFDLISIIPFFAKHLWWIYDVPIIFEYWRMFLLCENFKIVRFFYWFNCYELIMEYYEVSYSISSLMGFIIRIFFVLFLCFSIRHCIQDHDITLEFDSMKMKYFDEFYDMIVQLLGVAHGMRDSAWEFKDHIINIIFLCMGFCFLVKVTCLFWQHLNKYFASAFSENITYSQHEAYASFTGIPPELKDRIHMYLDFKYQGQYYKDHIIKNILSAELIKETRGSVSRSRLEKVKMFAAIPDDLIIKLEEKLMTDIFLPGDIIIKAGTKGNYLYFIVSGTVTVTGSTGDHICCLEDGANFGEIALILNQKRTTTIIAATPCELLVLKRSDYESVIAPYPDLKKMLMQEAFQRLHETVENVAEGPICHLYDPGRHTLSKGGSLEYKSPEDKEAFLEAIQRRSSLQYGFTTSASSSRRSSILLYGFTKSGSSSRRSSIMYKSSGTDKSEDKSISSTETAKKISSQKVTIRTDSINNFPDIESTKSLTDDRVGKK